MESLQELCVQVVAKYLSLHLGSLSSLSDEYLIKIFEIMQDQKEKDEKLVRAVLEPLFLKYWSKEPIYRDVLGYITASGSIGLSTLELGDILAQKLEETRNSFTSYENREQVLLQALQDLNFFVHGTNGQWTLSEAVQKFVIEFFMKQQRAKINNINIEEYLMKLKVFKLWTSVKAFSM